MSNVPLEVQSNPCRPGRMDGLILLLLIISLGLNVYFGWKVKQLERNSIPPEQAITLSPGTKVDPVSALSIDGKLQTISYETAGKATVFYVVSPSCIWCERNKTNIEKLSELKGNDFRFIGLSLTEGGLKQYLEGHSLNFPTYTGLKPEAIESLGLGATPQTIVISPDGRVIRNWKGAYGGTIGPEVEAYFGIQLPGLALVNN